MKKMSITDSRTNSIAGYEDGICKCPEVMTVFRVLKFL